MTANCSRGAQARLTRPKGAGTGRQRAARGANGSHCAQGTAQRGGERASRDLFPTHSDRVKVIAFSAARRIGIDAAEAAIAGWLDLEYTEPAVARVYGEEKKGPAIKGNDAGPETPS